MRAKFCENCVTRFVISGIFLICLRHYAALLLRPHNDFIDPFIKVVIGDRGSSRTGSQNRSLVQKICKIRSGESAGDPRDHFKVNVCGKRFIP